MLTRFLGWLGNIPVLHASERRNAVVMQCLLLFMIPWAWFNVEAGSTQGGSHALAWFVCGSAAVAFLLIRSGLFKWAAAYFISAMLWSSGYYYWVSGFDAIREHQQEHYVVLVMSSLLLGRRSLWCVYLGVLALLATGSLVDALRSGPAESPIPFIHAAGNYFIVAFLLDCISRISRDARADAMCARRQRATLAVRRLQLQRARQRTQEAPGPLVAGIAHDFAHVLELVLGFAARRREMQAIAAADERARAQERLLARVEEVAHRGVALVHKLSAHSRMQGDRFTCFDVGSALESLMPMFRQMFPPCVEIEASIAAGHRVRLDREEFELMLLNIAANARDALQGHAGRFTIAMRADAGAVVITLADTGAGMDEDTRRRMFEPFFSRNRAGVGTGLGLSNAMEFIKVAGGQIEVMSAVGQGTVLVIRLPCAETDSPRWLESGA